jgi:hypothetical protein
MTKPFAILLAVLSVAAMAAADVIEPARAAARRSIPTSCVTGPPASTSPYVIEYVAVGDPAAGNRFYDIDPAFSTDHSIGSTMVSPSSPLHEALPPPPLTNPPPSHLLKTRSSRRIEYNCADDFAKTL